jgi:hypothetical protein
MAGAGGAWRVWRLWGRLLEWARGGPTLGEWWGRRH